jgi:hypothetical protein
VLRVYFGTFFFLLCGAPIDWPYKSEILSQLEAGLWCKGPYLVIEVADCQPYVVVVGSGGDSNQPD